MLHLLEELLQHIFAQIKSNKTSKKRSKSNSNNHCIKLLLSSFLRTVGSPLTVRKSFDLTLRQRFDDDQRKSKKLILILILSKSASNFYNFLCILTPAIQIASKPLLKQS